jgi:hypothetical protein
MENRARGFNFVRIMRLQGFRVNKRYKISGNRPRKVGSCKTELKMFVARKDCTIYVRVVIHTTISYLEVDV